MKKILVVDDDENILDAISLVLNDEGYQVETSFKGEETFDKINKFKPDLILLDILMSGSDGRDICKKIKKTDTMKNIPVIMISAHPTARGSALKSGANDFLEKPFNTSDLISIIKKHIDDDK